MNGGEIYRPSGRLCFGSSRVATGRIRFRTLFYFRFHSFKWPFIAGSCLLSASLAFYAFLLGFHAGSLLFSFFCTPFSLGPSFYSFSASFVVHFFPSRRRALLLLSPKARYEFKKKREQVHDEAPENAFIKEPTRIPFQTRVSRKKDEGLAQRCRRLFVFVFAFRCAAIRTAAAWTRCRRSARRCPTASRWPPAPPRRRRRRRRRPRAPPLRPRRP